MNARQPFRAGSFYQASSEACRGEAVSLIESASIDNCPQGVLYGGLVPHAGWVYSGRLAAMTLKALSAGEPIETVVLFGADHTGAVQCAEVYPTGAWISPLGAAAVDEQAASKLIEYGLPFRPNPGAHDGEHSIEVQIPLLQVLCPEAMIVPIAVPPVDLAVDAGRSLAAVLEDLDRRWVVVGSTDLTHHGGHFGAPGGHGQAGLDFSVANDRSMLDLIEAMDAEEVIPQARTHRNACGAGAIAATIAACRQMGATRGHCLEYTNSQEVMRKIMPGTADETTVGYASVVFA